MCRHHASESSCTLPTSPQKALLHCLFNSILSEERCIACEEGEDTSRDRNSQRRDASRSSSMLSLQNHQRVTRRQTKGRHRNRNSSASSHCGDEKLAYLPCATARQNTLQNHQLVTCREMKSPRRINGNSGCEKLAYSPGARQCALKNHHCENKSPRHNNGITTFDYEKLAYSPCARQGTLQNHHCETKDLLRNKGSTSDEKLAHRRSSTRRHGARNNGSTSFEKLAGSTSDTKLADGPSSTGRQGTRNNGSTSYEKQVNSTSDKKLAPSTSHEKLAGSTSYKKLADRPSSTRRQGTRNNVSTGYEKLAPSTSDEKLACGTSYNKLADSTSDKKLACGTSNNKLASSTSNNKLASSTSNNNNNKLAHWPSSTRRKHCSTPSSSLSSSKTSLYLLALSFSLQLLSPPVAAAAASASAAGGGGGSDALSCHLTGVSCVPLSGPGTAPPTCYGAPLRFSYTALLWANHSLGSSSSLGEVTSRLRLWEGLSSVPECWAVVQPFLCSVYLPKCDNVKGRVEYPSRELCERTREPCKVVQHFAKQWPDFLRCSQPHFRQNCGSGAYDQLNYNTSGRCSAPLVRTEQKESWWGGGGVEGCGLQCHNPLFTPDKHRHAHVFVAVMGGLCLACTLFTILTFIIDWQNASRYPALILFFVNFCFMLATAGWLAQFSSGNARQDIVCRVDGTVRKAEPRLGSGETAACTVVFVLIYYFTMAGLLWFVMLCYAWHVTFRALGTPRDDLSSKTAYFHLVAWSIPLVLTIVCLAISEIDGDSLSGVCFVGNHNHSVRAGFVLVPVACVMIVGLFFLMKGMWTLVSIRKDAPEFVGEKAAGKIMETIIRIAIFSVLALLFGVTTFAIHIYIFIFERQWEESLDKYIHCRTNATVSRAVGSGSRGPSPSPSPSCGLEHEPSLVAMEINMFVFFGAGIIMSSWSWTKASLSAWQRFLKKMFNNKPSSQPVQHQHRQMITQAYERRHDVNNMSFQSTYDDPLGMKFDLHSLSSNMSHMAAGNFAHNMPLVAQRRALLHPATGALRRYSDSDIASLMSRRLSQGSLQQQAVAAAASHHGQFVFMERDNSSVNGSSVAGGGGWRRRRRRRKKRRKKRSGSNGSGGGGGCQPILGPVLSGMGFGPLKAAGGGVSRRGSESSVLSKASAQGIRMMTDKEGGGGRREGGGGGGGGSTSSFTANDRIPAGGTASGSDLRGGGGGLGPYPHYHNSHSRSSRRRKLPRLAPLSRHRRRSMSSSRSSISQFGMGGLHALHAHQQQQQQQQQQQAFSQFQNNPYAHLYAAAAAGGGGGYDYAQFYASLGYPPQMVSPQMPAYPFWYPPYPPPHPSQFPQPPPSQSSAGGGGGPTSPTPGSGRTTATGTAADFSLFSASASAANTTNNASRGGSVCSGDGGGERKRLVASSSTTSRLSEVTTIQTQKTELISLQKVKTSGGSDYGGSKAGETLLPLSDDSVEDLNSSELEDSAEEEEEEEEEEEHDEEEIECEEAVRMLQNGCGGGGSSRGGSRSGGEAESVM